MNDKAMIIGGKKECSNNANGMKTLSDAAGG